jgi:hypothetical protein
MIRALQRELAEQLPGGGYFEFWFGENGRQGKRRHRLDSPPHDPASSSQDLTPADIRLGPVDLEMLDALITAGTPPAHAAAAAGELPVPAATPRAGRRPQPHRRSASHRPNHGHHAT